MTNVPIPQAAHYEQSGFTFVELAISMGIIGVVTSIVIVAINPRLQFCQARNAERRSHEFSLTKSMQQYLLQAWDQGGVPPVPVGEANAIHICREGVTNDTTCINLDMLTPAHIPQLPVDEIAETNPNYTGYGVYRDRDGKWFAVTEHLDPYCAEDETLIAGSTAGAGDGDGGSAGGGSSASSSASCISSAYILEMGPVGCGDLSYCGLSGYSQNCTTFPLEGTYTETVEFTVPSSCSLTVSGGVDNDLAVYLDNELLETVYAGWCIMSFDPITIPVTAGTHTLRLIATDYHGISWVNVRVTTDCEGIPLLYECTGGGGGGGGSSVAVSSSSASSAIACETSEDCPVGGGTCTQCMQWDESTCARQCTNVTYVCQDNACVPDSSEPQLVACGAEACGISSSAAATSSAATSSAFIPSSSSSHSTSIPTSPGSSATSTVP